MFWMETSTDCPKHSVLILRFLIIQKNLLRGVKTCVNILIIKLSLLIDLI